MATPVPPGPEGVVSVGEALGIGTEENMPAGAQTHRQDAVDAEIDALESQLGASPVDEDDASIAERRFSEDMVKERSPRGRFLRFNQQLSSGHGKRVFTSYDTVDGLEVAWNEIDIRNMSKTELTKLQQELAMISELRHKHVISFHNRWRVGNEKVVYITNLTASGSLKEFCNRVKNIRWKAVKRWSRQILRGLQYLHGHDPRIIHRNLKCSNVFINGASGEIVIGELGLSTQQRSSLSRGIGTPGYMAPEQYQEAYDEKVDIFAFGMMALEMISGDVPYIECGDNPGEIHRRVMNQVEPMGISRVSEGRARGFIRACIRTLDRPSAAELLTHPFLKKDVNLDEEIVTLLDEEFSVGGESLDPSILSLERRLSDGSILPSLHDAYSDDEWDKGDDRNSDGSVSGDSAQETQRSHGRMLSLGSLSPSRASETVEVDFPDLVDGASHTREVVENVEVELIDVQEAPDATILQIKVQAQTRPDDQDKMNNTTISFMYDLARDNPASTVTDLQLHVEQRQNVVFENEAVLEIMRAELAKVVEVVEEAIDKQMDLDALTKADALSPRQSRKDGEGGAAETSALRSPSMSDVAAPKEVSFPDTGSNPRPLATVVPDVGGPAEGTNGAAAGPGSPTEPAEPAVDAKEEDWFDPYDPKLQAELAQLQHQVDLLEKVHARKLSDFGNQRAAEEDKYLKAVEALKEKHAKVQQRLQVKEEKQREQYQLKHEDLQQQMEATRERFREAQRGDRAEEERVWAKYSVPPTGPQAAEQDGAGHTGLERPSGSAAEDGRHLGS